MGPRRRVQALCDLRRETMAVVVQRSQGWRRTNRAGAASGGGLGLLRQATAAVTAAKAIMQLLTMKIEKPDDTNFILGQTHFIKSVEDIHEALGGAVSGIKFGLAFCEASGKCLVRWSGTHAAMTELAKKNATAIRAGHSFIVFL